jgi:hypothetical protein
MSSKSTSYSVIIVAALIGTIGTVTTALIRTWALKSASGSQDPAPIEKIDLSGPWYVQTTIKETAYNPYKDLVIRYKILVTQEGDSITANGNKIGEVFHGEERDYTGDAKTSISLTGTLSQSQSGDMFVRLNGQEDGTSRKSMATSFELRVLDRTRMVGTFASTAANSKGMAVWISEKEWQKTGWDNQ